MLYLSSPQNSQIKRLKALQAKAKTRKAEKAFVIEGIKEIAHAVNGGYNIETIFLKEDEQQPLINKIEGTETISVSSSLLEQICYRKTSRAIAVAKAKEHSLETFRSKSENPFILLAEAPEKPGNIGALLRTADAMGVDCFMIVDAKTDLYNRDTYSRSRFISLT